MRLGNVALRRLDAGTFWLDAGVMHGVVPKMLWSRHVEVDADNRAPYATGCLLVETAGRRVLVDTGVGDRLPKRERELYRMAPESGIVPALAAAGVAPESIDIVILTHLHFDHVGGALRRAGREVVPTFPRARLVVQRRELEDATRPGDERDRAAYQPENIDPLVAAGLFEPVDGEAEVAPGVRVLPAPGHTPGHQAVLVDGGGGARALFLGDLAPTALHVKLPWIMAYDLEPRVTLATKRRLFDRALADGWLVVFDHDAAHGGARLARDERGAAVVAELVAVE